MEYYESSFVGLGEATAGYMARHGEWPKSLDVLDENDSRGWGKVWHVEPTENLNSITLLAEGGSVWSLGEIVWRNFSTMELEGADVVDPRDLEIINKRIWAFYSQNGQFPSSEESHGIFVGLSDDWSLVRRRKLFSSKRWVTVSWANVEGESKRVMAFFDDGFARIDD